MDYPRVMRHMNYSPAIQRFTREVNKSTDAHDNLRVGSVISYTDGSNRRQVATNHLNYADGSFSYHLTTGINSNQKKIMTHEEFIDFLAGDDIENVSLSTEREEVVNKHGREVAEALRVINEKVALSPQPRHEIENSISISGDDLNHGDVLFFRSRHASEVIFLDHYAGIVSGSIVHTTGTGEPYTVLDDDGRVGRALDVHQFADAVNRKDILALYRVTKNAVIKGPRDTHQNPVENKNQ